MTFFALIDPINWVQCFFQSKMNGVLKNLNAQTNCLQAQNRIFRDFLFCIPTWKLRILTPITGEKDTYRTKEWNVLRSNTIHFLFVQFYRRHLMDSRDDEHRDAIAWNFMDANACAYKCLWIALASIDWNMCERDFFLLYHNKNLNTICTW